MASPLDAEFDALPDAPQQRRSLDEEFDALPAPAEEAQPVAPTGRGLWDRIKAADARARGEAGSTFADAISPITAGMRGLQRGGILLEELGAEGPGQWIQDFATHGRQGAMLSATDEVDAAGSAAAAAATGGNPLDRYRDRRAEGRAEVLTSQERSPVAAFMGNVAGSAPVAIPAAGAQGVIAAGTILGAGQGLGSSNADLTQGEVLPALVDTGFGSALGTVSSTLGVGVSKVAPPVLDFIGRRLQQAGIGFGRRALLNGADSLTRKVTPDDAVREALRPGPGGPLPGIVPFGTAKGALKRMERRVEALDAARESIIAKLEANGVPGLEARAVADEMIDRAAKEFATSGADKGVSNMFMREAQNIENLAQPALSGRSDGRLALTQAEAVKRDLQSKATKFYDVTGRPTPKAKATREIASIVRQANEDAVEAAGNAAPFGSEVADLAESFVPVKQRLGRSIKAMEAAEKGAQKGENRSWLGLAGKIGLASANPKAAAMSVATGGGMMNRLSSTAASGFYAGGALAQGTGRLLSRLPAHSGGTAGGLLERAGLDNYRGAAVTDQMQKIRLLLDANPAALGQYAPALQEAAAKGDRQFAATHFVLSQRAPEYRQLLDRVSAEKQQTEDQ